MGAQPVPERTTATPATEATAAPAVRRCASCGAPAPGPFCPECGQPERPARLRVRDVAQRLVGDALDLERGILHTAVELFRGPGALLRDYLRGRTVPFTNPVKYFLLALSLVQLAALWSGATADFAAGFAGDPADGPGGAAPGALAARTAELLDRFFPLLAAPAVPVLAAAQRLLFRRSGLNYAEQLVVALFLAGQQLLLLLPALLVSGRAKSAGAVAVVLLALAAAMSLHAWAMRQLLRLPWGGAIARSLGAQLLTALSYGVLLSVALGALGVLLG